MALWFVNVVDSWLKETFSFLSNTSKVVVHHLQQESDQMHIEETLLTLLCVHQWTRSYCCCSCFVFALVDEGRKISQLTSVAHKTSLGRHSPNLNPIGNLFKKISQERSKYDQRSFSLYAPTFWSVSGALHLLICSFLHFLDEIFHGRYI